MVLAPSGASRQRQPTFVPFAADTGAESEALRDSRACSMPARPFSGSSTFDRKGGLKQRVSIRAIHYPTSST
jgi:hypothetical protein